MVHISWLEDCIFVKDIQEDIHALRQEVEVVLQKLTDPLLALVQDLKLICAIARVTEQLETLVVEVKEAKVCKVCS